MPVFLLLFLVNGRASHYQEFSATPGVKIARPLSPQEYEMMEFDVIDLNRHRLVFAQPVPVK